jgi:hypothetical protein
MSVIIGTLVHHKGAYALDKFLANQQHIQRNYSDCSLLFATEETGYVDELVSLLFQWNLRGTVILFKVERPEYAKSRLWSIACGRESIRQYILDRSQANRLLFLDADMTYDPRIIDILETELINQDAVFSGYRFRNNHIGLTGAGCLLLRREALKKIRFRCYEFRNGQVINEDNVVEMDLYRQGCRIKKGFFLKIDHYFSPGESRHITPQKVGLYRKLMTSAFCRFWLIRISVAIQYNVPSSGQRIIWGILNIFYRLRCGRMRKSHF